MVRVDQVAPVEAPEPERDRWNRYVVVDPDGNRTSYRRCTSVAHKLGDSQGLEHWGKTMVASGVGQVPELAKLAAAHPDPKLARSVYKEIIEAAEEASGANAARRRGTALHKLTERLDTGWQLVEWGGKGELFALVHPQAEPIPVAADDAQRLMLYQACLAENNITMVPDYCEQVLLLDGLRIAGTCDRFGWTGLDGDRKLRTLDVKTGSLEYGQLEWAAQLSMYANHDARWSHVRDDEWERRPPIEGVCREWGVIIHLPASGEPSCTLHWLDLEAGYGGLIYASGLMEYRTLKVMTPYSGGVLPDAKAVKVPEAPMWEMHSPPELDEDGEPVAPRPALTLVPTGGDSPESEAANGVKADLTPELPMGVQVHLWIIERMAELGALWEAGTVGPLNMLVSRWPSTVPQPLPPIDNGQSPLSAVQVEDLVTQLDMVWREYQLPFSAPRPDAPKGKPTRPKPEPATKRARKAPAKAVAKRQTTRKTTNQETEK